MVRSHMNSYAIVEQFEDRVARFSGSSYAVSCESGTAALFLSMYYRAEFNGYRGTEVSMPLRTYASVPMAALQAGFDVNLVDYQWRGLYVIQNIGVLDGAKRFRKGMYTGGLHCLSFHAKKHIGIGRGGMILTDDKETSDMLKKLRYDGRDAKPYPDERITVMGFNMYMTPDQAARGLMLMDMMPSEGWPDQVEDYQPLTNHPVFSDNARVRCSSQFQYA